LHGCGTVCTSQSVHDCVYNRAFLHPRAELPFRNRVRLTVETVTPSRYFVTDVQGNLLGGPIADRADAIRSAISIASFIGKHTDLAEPIVDSEWPIDDGFWTAVRSKSISALEASRG